MPAFDVVGIEALLHARLVVGAREHAAEHLEHACFSTSALQSSLRQAWRTKAAAPSRSPCASKRARQHEAAFGGRRLMLGEEGAARCGRRRRRSTAHSRRGGGTAAHAASSDWRRRRRRSAGRSDWCCRERRITHSASLRATGSVMACSAASASASLPLRAASMTRLTAAMSAAEVAAVGASAKGPETGRASGLNVRAACENGAVQADIGLRKGGQCRRRRWRGALAAASGAICCALGVAACLPAWIAGRGRWQRELAAATAGTASALMRRRPRRQARRPNAMRQTEYRCGLRLVRVAFNPLPVSPGDRRLIASAATVQPPIRPIIVDEGYPKSRQYGTLASEGGQKRGRRRPITPIHGAIGQGFHRCR